MNGEIPYDPENQIPTLDSFSRRPDPQPETSVPYELYDGKHGVDPAVLIPDYRLKSDNRDVPYHGVTPVGPQAGTALHVLGNLGSMIFPGIKRYLEESGQRQVGVLPRVLAIQPKETWDEPYAVNPSVEVL